MDSTAVFISSLGLIVFAIRFWPGRRSPPTKISSHGEDLPTISVIVPCRNEAANLGNLLQSLEGARTSRTEIIVVDDASTDDTYEIASRSAGVRVLQAPPKPAGWVGKTWACQVGFRASRGDYVLFTDADTRHRPGSLARALAFMTSYDLDGLSAPPFHAAELGWDRYLGLFHLLPMIASPLAGAAKGRVGARTFAIGQYLLFRRESYERIGGHAAVHDSLAEDLELVRRLGDAGIRYGTYPQAKLYDVQMYSNFGEFYSGWRRIIRMGLSKTTLTATLEIFLVFHLFATPVWPILVAIPLLAWTQRRFGKFSGIGTLAAPLSVFLFTVLSAHALCENLLRRPMAWRRRVYEVHGDSSKIAG